MKVLVLGAGGTGGYFGGRCAAAGADVSFLVRPARAALLRDKGLRIVSPTGDLLVTPTLVTADQLQPGVNHGYDLVILSCKAYDLDSAIEAIRPAIGPATTVLPLLNGMRHFDRLDTEFGPQRVLGGLCQISVMLGSEGEIRHMGKLHGLAFGERDGSVSERCQRIEKLFAPAAFDARLSTTIQQDLWDKFVFLTTLASITCLFRGNVGQIVRSDDGGAILLELLGECQAVAAASGYPIRAQTNTATRAMFAVPDSPMTASMMRDLEAGNPIEAQQITGEMLHRGRILGTGTALLRVAYAALQTYQNRSAG